MSERSHTDEKDLESDIDVAIAETKLLPSIDDLDSAPKEMIQRRLRVLIVEDNNADARLVQALVEETGYPTQITRVVDGERAIQLMESAAKGEAPVPDLVLLDINLPKKDGHEVLASIREYASSVHTSIAMCSGSSSCEDMRRARNNGANAYLLKPMDLVEMEEIVTRLRNILVSLNEGSNNVASV